MQKDVFLLLVQGQRGWWMQWWKHVTPTMMQWGLQADPTWTSASTPSLCNHARLQRLG